MILNILKKVIKSIKKHDVVFGYRNKRDDGYIRKIFSLILSLFIFLELLLSLKTFNVPYRIIKKKFLKKVVNDIK